MKFEVIKNIILEKLKLENLSVEKILEIYKNYFADLEFLTTADAQFLDFLISKLTEKKDFQNAFLFAEKFWKNDNKIAERMKSVFRAAASEQNFSGNLGINLDKIDFAILQILQEIVSNNLDKNNSARILINKKFLERENKKK